MYSDDADSNSAGRSKFRGVKQKFFEKCNIKDWNGEFIILELNHKDGDNSNHKLENLELLCPNCHSQTPTFKAKNIKLKNAERKNGGTHSR